MPRLVSGAVVAALVAAAASPAAIAAAAEPPPVTVVRHTDADPVMVEVANRTQAELSASGFAAIMKDCARAVADCLAEVVAQPDRRLAGVATFRDGEEIATEVRVTSRGAFQVVAQVVRRGSVQQNTIGADEAAVLAIRAVELVRATLLQAESLPPPPSPAPSQAGDLARVGGPPPEITAATGWSIGGGGAVLESAHGFSAAYALLLRAGYRGAEGWSGSLVVAGPGFTSDQPTSSGALRVRQELAAVELGYAFARQSPVQPRLTMGLGVHHIEARPTDGTPLAQDSAFTLLASAGAGVLVVIGKYVALFFDAQAIFTEPNAADLVAGGLRSRLGSPSLLISLGIQRTF